MPRLELLFRFPIQLLFAGVREEFWYRALLQTKRECLFRHASTAGVAGSVLFALWHVPIALSEDPGLSWIGAVVRCLGGQGANGFLTATSISARGRCYRLRCSTPR
ncbi:MAG: hypothetical protein COY42_15550 [Armatimonadetes bacterium CG_4_10_14_0_8_um_filter_66_14]|nr:MAG: hypothetical protein COZ57_20930 [Armatimonadetes bacterium CG_4_8_14_3_um_filter_66_20]PIZ43615.1 MAG: hypothetical protein COY42_15550 [Armatimonadetes bacterium CG_4_10_14_0_8_um_filter_66_14]